MNTSWKFPYASQRMPVFAKNVVATSQPLAAQAGLRMLMKGGNAVDAALATAIALTVVEPTSNGIGGDAFALIWNKGKLWGLNGSGKSPQAWNYERFSGFEEMSQFGWDSVTVPGAVDAWATLSNKLGKLPFADLFIPGIEYANSGFLVSPITADRWSEAQEKYLEFPEFCKTFLPMGKSPLAGQIFRCPDQAASLAGIAESNNPEDLIGKKVVIVANLEAAKIMGVESRGMILAVEKENGEMQIVTVDNSVKNGTRVK